jgi:hypothetical protein
MWKFMRIESEKLAKTFVKHSTHWFQISTLRFETHHVEES